MDKVVTFLVLMLLAVLANMTFAFAIDKSLIPGDDISSVEYVSAGVIPVPDPDIPLVPFWPVSL